jgi:hypothetical protein
MASTMEMDSKQYHVLFQCKLLLTRQTKLNNLKIIRDLGIIGEEEFKDKVNDIFDL